MHLTLVALWSVCALDALWTMRALVALVPARRPCGVSGLEGRDSKDVTRRTCPEPTP